jgi:hypothetical protein
MVKGSGSDYYVSVRGLIWSCQGRIHVILTITLVEHFKFFGEKISEKCFAFYSNFPVKNQVENLELLHEFFELQNFFSTFSDNFHKVQKGHQNVSRFSPTFFAKNCCKIQNIFHQNFQRKT